MSNKLKKTASLWVIVDKEGIMVESVLHGWKQYIDIWKTPKAFAKELKQIANNDRSE